MISFRIDITIKNKDYLPLGYMCVNVENFLTVYISSAITEPSFYSVFYLNKDYLPDKGVLYPKATIIIDPLPGRY